MEILNRVWMYSYICPHYALSRETMQIQCIAPRLHDERAPSRSIPSISNLLRCISID